VTRKNLFSGKPKATANQKAMRAMEPPVMASIARAFEVHSRLRLSLNGTTAINLSEKIVWQLLQLLLTLTA